MNQIVRIGLISFLALAPVGCNDDGGGPTGPGDSTLDLEHGTWRLVSTNDGCGLPNEGGVDEVIICDELDLADYASFGNLLDCEVEVFGNTFTLDCEGTITIDFLQQQCELSFQGVGQGEVTNGKQVVVTIPLTVTGPCVEGCIVTVNVTGSWQSADGCTN